MICKWCGLDEAEQGNDFCPECDHQQRLDNKFIDQLISEGHTRHCACRQVWGDGECSCALEKVYDPYWWMKIEPRLPFTTA